MKKKKTAMQEVKLNSFSNKFQRNGSKRFRNGLWSGGADEQPQENWPLRCSGSERKNQQTKC